MMKYQQREFCSRVLDVCVRTNKFCGHLIWLAERVQLGAPLHGADVDCFYDRWYRLEDAIKRLKETATWQCVDVEDLDD